MTLSQLILLGLYVPISLFLAFYGFHRAGILFEYLVVRKRDPKPKGRLEELPTVLVQIPVYNERTVVRRVLEAVSRIRYPQKLLRIQVCDDSTDETVEIAEEACAELRARGFDIEHLRRPNREGFKAGALSHGLERDDSELVAIFDADFVPKPDYLERTVHYFSDDGVGLVQCRWEHMNLDQNLLTRLQTFLLDGHFILEHTYRNRTGRFISFNGTAGLWRRRCIDDAGGWSHTSITEDIEISLRAQLRGWRFVYLRDETVPAEVPADVDAWKGQQHRWAKGYTEVMLEQLPSIWKARIPLKTKLEATAMLSNHAAFLMLGALTILHLPLVLVRSSFPSPILLQVCDLLSLWLVVFSVFAFYFVSQLETRRLSIRRIAEIPLVLGLAVSLTANSCRGVLEALFGTRSEFVRTPKEGDAPARSYKAASAVGQALVEIAFGLYLLLAAWILVARGHVAGLWLSLIVAGGFLTMGLGTLRNRWRRRPAPAPEPSAAKVPAAERG